jgi:hypothetical protein
MAGVAYVGAAGQAGLVLLIRSQAGDVDDGIPSVRAVGAIAPDAGDPSEGRSFNLEIQNSTCTLNAIIRGELSPPSPTPSSPVGGAVV